MKRTWTIIGVADKLAPARAGIHSLRDALPFRVTSAYLSWRFAPSRWSGLRRRYL
jgi:hypothetical protein